jgi:hypothetical protein
LVGLALVGLALVGLALVGLALVGLALVGLANILGEISLYRASQSLLDFSWSGCMYPRSIANLSCC